MSRATILFSAPDRPGLVARLSGFFYELALNITEASNYTDQASARFYMRIVVDLSGLSSPAAHEKLGGSATRSSMEQTFGTTCHGAGRAMSRTAAVKDAHARQVQIDRELEKIGIIARARSRKELPEEQPRAYKDVDLVVDVVHKAGLSKKVARFRPIGVIKG